MITAKGVGAETDDGTAAASADGSADKSRPRRMLNEKQVLEIVPVSRTTLFRLEKAGKFPRATYISPNRRVWFEDEIIAWQHAVDEFNPHRARGKGRRAHTIAAVGGKPDAR
ncbi:MULTISPECIES: AlpA family phage regulatory protein [unclassified Bradyrhizobium]|uniref:helix-turn-helix transcriptional regulator n=1 Tax=unclassified Bradyrhizobium TaxID=2631580 RepID=UPI00247913A8|nr:MULTISPECIES: AlpA family phage regulatory protein [unclassified Bradyrhizobium]WGR70199.1 AlpA family transcriptional regulator [Bradyrhizobium sp. ISRA426]WGR82256.1 AlpA family transcriptional regulator [Bradyrhizobium sp. ISRA430]WGR85442.1 AlpA family transcriptional regulator [Bradyrhizobium sp. ISRA432]